MGRKHDQIDRSGVEGHLAVYRSWPYSTTDEALPSCPALAWAAFLSLCSSGTCKQTYIHNITIITILSYIFTSVSSAS